MYKSDIDVYEPLAVTVVSIISDIPTSVRKDLISFIGVWKP
jgi:hypothetical protein